LEGQIAVNNEHGGYQDAGDQIQSVGHACPPISRRQLSPPCSHDEGSGASQQPPRRGTAAQHFGCMQGVLLDLALVLPIWKEAASALQPTKERAQPWRNRSFQSYGSRRMPW